MPQYTHEDAASNTPWLLEAFPAEPGSCEGRRRTPSAKRRQRTDRQLLYLSPCHLGGHHNPTAAIRTAIGSNLGANLTPIGVLAGIMWMTILSKRAVRVTYAEFEKHGLLVTAASLLSSLAFLTLQLAAGVRRRLLASARNKTQPSH
ncbi:hypothetical protein H5T54_04595 [Candidatus Bipolaricaulota bacterium]|nr:hypothetical protein [Candidatus Bipolaricaulota bacterium]